MTFIIGAMPFLAALAYFVYARYAFFPRGGDIQTKLWEPVLTAVNQGMEKVP